MLSMFRFFLVLLSIGILGACSTIRVPTNTREVSSVEAEKGWTHVLKTHVDTKGRVNFSAVAKSPNALAEYVGLVSRFGPKTQPQNFKNKETLLAFYLNSYNALSMYNIIDAGIPESLSGLKKVSFFYFTKFVIDGETMSLYDYENEFIRKQGDERVHFALNCMSKGCPRLPQTPFEAKTLNADLDRLAKEFFNESRNVNLDEKNKTAHISQILEFFTGDFLTKEPNLIAYVNRYRIEKIPADYKVEFIPYDWGVNAQPTEGKSVTKNFQTEAGSKS